MAGKVPGVSCEASSKACPAPPTLALAGLTAGAAQGKPPARTGFRPSAQRGLKAALPSTKADWSIPSAGPKAKHAGPSPSRGLPFVRKLGSVRRSVFAHCSHEGIVLHVALQPSGTFGDWPGEQTLEPLRQQLRRSKVEEGHRHRPGPLRSEAGGCVACLSEGLRVFKV